MERQENSKNRRIIVLSDGTWCGRETGTHTNIYHLATLMGLPADMQNAEDEYTWTTPTAYARYRHGVGLNSTFLDYLFNGVTAQDLAKECISAYKFIVNTYTGGNDIWLFGLSRGAYTVRCVAGMINNCGIVHPRRTTEETEMLCQEVYRIYRSSYPINHPSSPQSKNFRRRNSWPLVGDEENTESPRRPPVRFMGLFDTVGSLGIPTFTGGVGLEWPKFHDQDVSSVVDQVYHLVSLHDRFYILQPCLASRKDGSMSGIEEEWIPGVHYDLGGQRFRFFRSGAGRFEGLLAKLGLVSKTIEPNEVLADFALVKMLKCIRNHDQSGIIPEVTMNSALESMQARIRTGQNTGDGDVYAKIVKYTPFGQYLWVLFTAAFRMAPSFWELLFALRDRLIPDSQANVYDFQTKSLGELAGITPERYPSNTLQSWLQS